MTGAPPGIAFSERDGAVESNIAAWFLSEKARPFRALFGLFFLAPNRSQWTRHLYRTSKSIGCMYLQRLTLL
jgi:hypothetical protein